MQAEAIAHVGFDIRALRKGRGMTLAALSEAINRSTGWLSHVERGQLEPGISDLKLIARVFEIPVSLLFRNADAPEREQGIIVRAANRTRLGNEEDGLLEEFLSPGLSGPFEMTRATDDRGRIPRLGQVRPLDRLGTFSPERGRQFPVHRKGPSLAQSGR